MKYLIINADDIGMQYAVNEGVRLAASGGLITSVSVGANGVALDDACERLLPSFPQLGVGAHVTLNEGNVCAPPEKVPLLAGVNGAFRYIGAKGFIRLALHASMELKVQVKLEMKTQLEILLKRTRLDHIDGHQHVHAIPWIFKIALELAKEYAIPFIRIPREPWHLTSFKQHIPHLVNMVHYGNLQYYTLFDRCYIAENSNVRANDYFYGLLHTSAMSEAVGDSLLQAHNQNGITEILFHPAISTNETSQHEDETRKLQLEALLSKKIKKTVEKNYVLTNYRNLV